VLRGVVTRDGVQPLYFLLQLLLRFKGAENGTARTDFRRPKIWPKGTWPKNGFDVLDVGVRFDLWAAAPPVAAADADAVWLVVAVVVPPCKPSVVTDVGGEGGGGGGRW
jgi:hypothetical protein